MDVEPGRDLGRGHVEMPAAQPSHGGFVARLRPASAAWRQRRGYRRHMRAWASYPRRELPLGLLLGLALVAAPLTVVTLVVERGHAPSEVGIVAVLSIGFLISRVRSWLRRWRTYRELRRHTPDGFGGQST